MRERRFRQPIVTNVSAKFATDKVQRGKDGCRGWRRECSIDSPSDPSRIDEARLPSRSGCQRNAWPSLSIPLQGTTRACSALYAGRSRSEREGEMRSISLAVDRREKGSVQRGIMSTRKAPGSRRSEPWSEAASTTSTMGSSCSLTTYPWEIIKMTAPAVLKVHVCQKRWICQSWDQKIKFARHDATNGRH